MLVDRCTAEYVMLTYVRDSESGPSVDAQVHGGDGCCPCFSLEICCEHGLGRVVNLHQASLDLRSKSRGKKHKIDQKITKFALNLH